MGGQRGHELWDGQGGKAYFRNLWEGGQGGGVGYPYTSPPPDPSSVAAHAAIVRTLTEAESKVEPESEYTNRVLCREFSKGPYGGFPEMWVGKRYLFCISPMGG